MRFEDPLDPVEGSADDAQVLARNSVGAQLLARERRQLGDRGRISVEPHRDADAG